MVRLKPYKTRAAKRRNGKFQFLNGTIKAAALRHLCTPLILFQFLNGTIKARRASYTIAQDDARFNS